MSELYTLYGGDISYYSGKARSYLRFKRIPHQELTATREVYKEVIMPRVGWPVIPVVISPDDETLQDTTDIIDALEARFPEPSIYPSGPRQHLVALLLEVYGDEWLKLPAMHYRWNHNTDWIIREFGRLSRPDASEAEQIEAGTRTCKPFRGSLPALGVTEATIAAVEASYEALLGDLDAHFAAHPFLFGERPSIGDFGLIGPLYAHQYRDPASGALMERLAPNVVAWVKRMMGLDRSGERRDSDRRDSDRRDADRRDDERRAAERRAQARTQEDRRALDRREESRREQSRRDSARREAQRREVTRTDDERTGNFLADDAIPATLIPVIERMVTEQFPVLAATQRAFDAWADAHPDEPVPRAIGMHAFTLGAGTPHEATAERAIFPFELWMFQRARRYHASLTGADRDAVDALMQEIGGLDVLTQPVRTELKRENFQLVRA